MDLLLHFKVNEGDENNINIQEYMLYGDVETKSEKCLVDEGDEVVLTEFPVPEFKNCTLMKKGDEGFYEYKDYRQGENAELAGGYAVSGILQQNKRFDFNYVNDQINGIVQNPFYKVETMGDYQIPMRVLDAYNDLYVATLATTEYIYYLHDSDDVFHEEDTNDFSPWSDRSINNILRIGSGFVNGKYRIYHLYTAMNVNAKDKATYLKNEYGIGGRTYDFKNKKQDKGYIDHDSKGLTICVSSKDSASLFKDSESKTFSWADVSSRIERLIATGKYFTDEEMEHYNSMNKDEILPAWLLEKCGLSDYTNNSQAVARPDWMEEHEILIDRDDDYVLLRDPDENVKQVWTASGEFLSTVQLENETVDEAMEEYYHNISKGDIEL